MFYSPTSHNAGTSGFFLERDKHLPSDAFPVSESDFQACITAPLGSTYTFTAPINSGVYGVLTLHAPPAPTTAELLAQAKATQIETLKASYKIAIDQPVTFKNAAGVTSTYAFGSATVYGGTNAQDFLTQIIDAGSTAWTAKVWPDTNGVLQTMTFADLQGLAAAIEAQETPSEQDLLTKIAQVHAATTVKSVQSIAF